MNIKQSQSSHGTTLCAKLIWSNVLKGLFAGFTKQVTVPVSNVNRAEKNGGGQGERSKQITQLKQKEILQT